MFEKLNKIEQYIFSGLSVFLVLFYSLSAVWIPAATQYHRGIYVFVTYILVLMLYKSENKYLRVLDYVLMLLSGATVLYWIFNFEAINYRAGAETQLDQIVSAIGVLIGIEIARRAVGTVFVIIGAVMLIYGVYGQYFPDI
ncbi:MAG: TRAP transporter permease, partial [Calditrichaeota bacterium]|nr:TRAP transporter permease [Calditrichota bacterium]